MTKTRLRSDQDANHERIAVCILAGGQSARMGRDKSRLRFGGRTMLAHVRAAAEATDWPIRVIRRDAVPQCGPLGGIYTALKSSRVDAELFLACDMPFISPNLLMDIAQRLNSSRDAVFTTAGHGAGFPFLLRATVLPVVEEHIRARRHSLQALATALQAKLFRVPRNQLLELWNINTPEDWQHAQRLRESAPKERRFQTRFGARPPMRPGYPGGQLLRKERGKRGASQEE